MAIEKFKKYLQDTKTKSEPIYKLKTIKEPTTDNDRTTDNIKIQNTCI